MLVISTTVAVLPQLSPPIEAPLLFAVIVVVALVVQVQVGEAAKFHWVASTLTEGGNSTVVHPASCPASPVVGRESALASHPPPPHTPPRQPAVLVQAAQRPQPPQWWLSLITTTHAPSQ